MRDGDEQKVHGMLKIVQFCRIVGSLRKFMLLSGRF